MREKQRGLVPLPNVARMHDENANSERMRVYMRVYVRTSCSMRVLAGDIRQTNDMVQNTICSDSQSIENSRR